jgi:4-hydroxy-tetrahydrodipicolinate reductase
MTLRVIQWGTGNVGHHSLRGILERPELELVGLRVFDPAKVGVDAGEMLGERPIGVVGTDDVDEILGLDADVVLYNALGTTLVDLQVPLDEVCRLLESGKNVISSAIDLFIYLKPGVAPAYIKPEMVEQLRAACGTGSSSVYSTGMTPGFALDLWPVTMARTSRRVDSIRVKEMVSLRGYRSSTVEFMGFGLPPDADVEMFKMFVESPENPKGGALNTPYGAAIHFVGDAFGVDIDSVTYNHTEVRTAGERMELPGGTFEKGTVVGTEFRLSGLVQGREFIALDFCWRVDDEGWAPNLCAWELEIEGDPSVKSRMEFATQTDARRSTSITVAGHCLNAIPKVVASPPGILDHVSIPIFTSRGAASLNNP